MMQAAEPIPQFFISLINNSEMSVTLESFCASAHCGWISEPLLDEVIEDRSERVWCGMPRQISTPIDIELNLRAENGHAIDLRFRHHHPEPATGLASVGTGSVFTAETELRSKASSPYLIVTLSRR